MRPARIVVLGGGFAGLHTALHLERLLRRHRGADVTLVSQENFFLFTPMLHEVASSDLDVTHIVSPLRTLVKRTAVVVADVTGIDLEQRVVHVVHGVEGHEHALPFDQLVIALGSTTNFYGLPGLEQRALTMKTLGDAIHLRNRTIALLEEAGAECAAGAAGAVPIVVAGGGFAGVETIAGLNDFVKSALRYYPRIGPDAVRMVLVHAGPVILPELGGALGAYAQRKLAERGIEILTEAKVAAVDHDSVALADGRRIPARLVVWTAGTSPHPLLHRLPCQLDHGRVVVDQTLAVPGWPGVWALGDCAVIPNPRTGTPHPPTAQHALREARTAAENIAAAIDGRPASAFEFQTIAQLAAIGRRTGVARIFGVTFSGFAAWWLWRTVYLSKLPRLEKKIRVAIDWTLDLLFERDFVQFLTERETAMSYSTSDRQPVTADAGGSPSTRM